jgi:hypothetical protein
MVVAGAENSARQVAAKDSQGSASQRSPDQRRRRAVQLERRAAFLGAGRAVLDRHRTAQAGEQVDGGAHGDASGKTQGDRGQDEPAGEAVVVVRQCGLLGRTGVERHGDVRGPVQREAEGDGLEPGEMELERQGEAEHDAAGVVEVEPAAVGGDSRVGHGPAEVQRRARGEGQAGGVVVAGGEVGGLGDRGVAGADPGGTQAEDVGHGGGCRRRGGGGERCGEGEAEVHRSRRRRRRRARTKRSTATADGRPAPVARQPQSSGGGLQSRFRPPDGPRHVAGSAAAG